MSFSIQSSFNNTPVTYVQSYTSSTQKTSTLNHYREYCTNCTVDTPCEEHTDEVESTTANVVIKCVQQPQLNVGSLRDLGIISNPESADCL
jgi:hypothetical protein